MHSLCEVIMGPYNGVTLDALENRLVISDCCRQTSAALPVSLIELVRDRTAPQMVRRQNMQPGDFPNLVLYK
jgi:hypothetical protein